MLRREVWSQEEEGVTENACPYCKGAGVQMLPVRVAKPDEKGLVEERLGARVLIEPVHCWKCMGTGKPAL